ncbi:sodium:calcium antiporter [Aphanothece hegewaldii CCALA 016]|uniref:Sodium:calcium antiporter n=1 Tax=Aphanothece hegewaldii CCALA 016 TaxID=2107694 RepID=A0A2T1LUQ3_9CHRO|nr:calcium/sodium antiporter [Aphanothece hegewaldii]PSF35293.1 sodium:calcium antiporter [Aphanothece hegewaldii CCALA 016]
MNITVILLLLAGLVLLVVGAELLVRGASDVATRMGISPLIVGLTIVAYGTSSPEMAVSIQSGLAGNADIALGNVVGSNIFNVLAILGIAAIIAPMMVANQLIRIDVPIMIGVSVLALMFGADGKISRVDGIILFILGVLYTAFQIYEGRRQAIASALEDSENGNQRQRLTPQQIIINIALILAGLVLLVLGSQFLIDSSISIAKAIGVSDLVIGLTIVAAGTSLPELASSVIASFKGEQDIAVGNVVGSNIFNILAVLGLSAVVSANGINVSDAALRFDVPVMIAVAIACLPIFSSGRSISRWEGILFLFYYVVYTAYLILQSTNHSQLPMFSQVMTFFVIPITVVTIAVSYFRSHKRSRI